MRSASSERKRPWGAPPVPKREPKQAVKLTVPSITPSEISLSSLHTRLSTLTTKITEFVNASVDALVSNRATGSTQQERFLDELQQEKERWEHHVFYALTLEEDALQHLGLETASCDLGSAVGDFKRVSQLVADAQNQVTQAMRRAARRDDASLNSRLWQVFTALNQNIYEAFFRRRRTETSDDPRVKQLEARLAECQEALRAKDSEVQNIERRLARDRELFTKVEYAAQLESDLRNAEELTRKLRTDLAARDLALKDLERRVRSSEGSPRFKLKEEPRFTDKRPSSALREPAVNWKELETELQREREKSRSFFNALKRKEKECDELYESLGSKALEEVEGLKREKEELTKALSEARRTEQRQTTEMSQLAILVKSLEREKARLEAEKTRAPEVSSHLQGQLDEQAQANEDLRRQLKLVLEDKQKLLRILSQTKAELTRTAEGYTRIERERDLLEQKSQALVQEKEILLRQISKQDIRKAEALVAILQARLEAQFQSLSNRLLQREERLEQVENQCKEGLQHYDAMLREANDRTGEQLEEAEARVRAREAELKALAHSLSQAQEEASHWMDEHNLLEQKFTEMQASLKLQSKEKDATIQQLQYELEILESENANIKEEMSTIKDELQTLQSLHVEHSREADARLDKLHLQGHSHKAETVELQRQLSIQLELSQRLQQEVSDVKWHLDEAETQNKALEHQVRTLQTRSNDVELEEVRALLQEVQGQLATKQAELEEAEQLNLSLQSQMKATFSSAEAEELKALREEKSEMEMQLDDAFARLQDNEQFRNQAEERLCELQEDHRKGLAELAATQKLLRDIQEENRELKLQQGQLRHSSEEPSADLQVKQLISKSIEALQGQEAKLKQEITTLGAQLSTATAENKRLRVETLGLQDQARVAELSITSLKEELTEAQKQHSGSLKRIRTQYADDMQAKDAEIATLREEMQTLRQKAEKEVKELVSKSIAALQGQETQLQQRLKETNAAFSDLEVRYNQTTRELEGLKTAKAQLADQIVAMKAAYSSDLHDKTETISQLTLQLHTSETAADLKVKELISKSLEALQGQEAKLKQELVNAEGHLGTALDENKKLIRETVNLQEQMRVSALTVTSLKEELGEVQKQHSLSLKRLRTQHMSELEAKAAEIAALKEETQSALNTAEKEKREIVTKSLAALQGQEAQLQQELQSVQERCAALTQERDLAVAQVEDLRRLTKELEGNVDTLQKNHSREMQEKQEERMKLVAKSIEALQGQEAKFKQEMATLEERLSAVAAENKNFRAEVIDLQDKIRTSTITTNTLREELEEAHKQHNASLKRIRTQFTNEEEAKSTEIASLKDQIKAIQEKTERERLELISKSIEALQGQEVSFKQQVAQLEAATSQKPSLGMEHTSDVAILSFEPALDSLSSQLAALRNAYASVEAEHNSLQQQYVDLKDTSDKQKNQIQHLTALLKQAKDTTHKLKGSSDSSREHRRIDDLNAHLAELSSQKEELEGALVAALRERERRKGEMANLGQIFKRALEELEETATKKWEEVQNRLDSLDERVGSVFALALKGLSNCGTSPAKDLKQVTTKSESAPAWVQTLRQTEQRVTDNFEKVEQRLSSLQNKSLVLAKGLLMFKQQTRSRVETAFQRTASQGTQQFQRIEEKLTLVDNRASDLTSRLLVQVSQFAEHKKPLLTSLKKGVVSLNATMNTVAETVETHLEAVDQRVSALLSRQIEHLAAVKERGNEAEGRRKATTAVLVDGFRALGTVMTETSETVWKRLESVDSRASSLLSKAFSLIVQRTQQPSQVLSILQAGAAAVEAKLEQVSTQVNTRLEGLDSRTSALLARSLQDISALVRCKAATYSAVRDLLLSFSVPSLETVQTKLAAFESRFSGLFTHVITLKNENKRLRTLLTSQNSENQLKITRLSEEAVSLQDNLRQMQAEHDFKLQRLRKAQASQELDTFALVDLREETLAQAETACRRAEQRVSETEMRLSTVQKTWIKAKKGWEEKLSRSVLSTITALAEQLSLSAALRLQRMEKRLQEAGLKIQEYQRSDKPIDTHRSLFKPAASHEAIKISLHLDDSLEFTPLEPSHRRGSSVNTSLDDMRQALGNMRVCRKLSCEGQAWVLTATLTDEPEYYWWREQDLPSADLLQGETADDEAHRELDIVKNAHLEALGDLQKTKADLEMVLAWLARQGYDMKQLSLEAALNAVSKPWPRVPLSPISAEGSLEVTIIHEGESSQTPKMGKDAFIIPAPMDSELDGLLETIQQQEAENTRLLQQNEAQSTTLQQMQTALSRAVSTLQDSPVLPHDAKGAEVLRQLLTLLARPVWKPN